MNITDTFVFDMGGVLIDLDRRACIEEFNRLGFPQADKLLNSYRQKGIFGELELGNITPRQLYEEIKQESGRDITPEQIDHALNLFLVGIQSWKLDLVTRLRSKYKVFMLSNTNEIMFSYAVREFFEVDGRRMSDYFDDLFLSCRMHVMKPDEQIFREMIDRTGMIPGNTLFIDDGKHNIEAAEKLGFRTYMPEAGENYAHILEAFL